jgi:hypothetical protein
VSGFLRGAGDFADGLIRGEMLLSVAASDSTLTALWRHFNSTLFPNPCLGVMLVMYEQRPDIRKKNAPDGPPVLVGIEDSPSVETTQARPSSAL